MSRSLSSLTSRSMIRVDDVVVFQPLDRDHLFRIIDLLVNELNDRLIDQELQVELSDDVKEWIIEHYYQPTYGARPMKRAIQKTIEDPLAEQLLRGRFKDLARVRVELENGEPAFVEAPVEELTSVS